MGCRLYRDPFRDVEGYAAGIPPVLDAFSTSIVAPLWDLASVRGRRCRHMMPSDPSWRANLKRGLCKSRPAAFTASPFGLSRGETFGRGGYGGPSFVRLSCYRRLTWLEQRSVHPDAVQDRRQFACERDLGPFGATSAGYVLRPALERRGAC